MQLSTEVDCTKTLSEFNPFAIQLDEPMPENAAIAIPFKRTAGVYDGSWYYLSRLDG